MLNLFNPFKGELTANQVVSDVNLGNHTLTVGGTSSGQSIIASGLVVNQDGGNLATDDFRAETVGNANAFVVDASADTVNVAVPFIATSTANVTENLTVNTDTLFVDATNNRVGIGTTSPDTTLQVVGDTKLGDDNTNYASFATDGELTLTGTARVYKNIFIDANALGTGGAAPASHTVNGSGFEILEFADAADDYAEFNINVPSDMDVTANCEIRITWSVPNTSADMTWGYGYCICGENEDTEGTPTTGTTVVTSSGTADGKTSDTLFTISGGTLAVGDLLQVYFYRDVSEDSYGAPVDVHGCAMKYVASKLGVAL